MWPAPKTGCRSPVSEFSSAQQHTLWRTVSPQAAGWSPRTWAAVILDWKLMIKDGAEDALPVASALKCAPKCAREVGLPGAQFCGRCIIYGLCSIVQSASPHRALSCLSKHTPNSLPVGSRNTHTVSLEAGLENP